MVKSLMAASDKFQGAFVILSLAAAALGWSQGASAQYVMEFAQTYNAPMSNFITGTFANQQTLINAITPGKSHAPARKAAPSFVLAPAQVKRSAAELAGALPAQHRAKMEKVYSDVMPGYHQIERKLGWPADDLAGAITALLAGNYMAMTGTEPSDAAVIAAARQLRASPSIQDMAAKLSPSDRRRLYEQCAMLGTFMTLANRTISQQPANVVANFRRSARLNLRAVLGTSGDKLRFSEGGLILR